jgi:hypothetical protein
MDIVKIILGVLATVVGTVAAFYATSSMLLAQKQLIAATRLSAYLTYWQGWILERELFGIYHLGMEWNKETLEIARKGGGPAELVKLQEEKKKFLSQVREQLEKGVPVDRDKLVRFVQRLPKDSIGSILEWSKTTRQNLIDGKTFISDEEAAALGVAFTNQAIALKMGIIDLVDGGTTLILSIVAAPADFEIKDSATEISQIVWKGILVSKNIDSIARGAGAIASKSVMALTLQNIRKGSRLTKR